MEHLEVGRKVYSKTELKAVLAAHRSEFFPNGAKLSEHGWCGHTDQHLKRWDAIPRMISQEERRQEMAEFLGMPIEAYDQKFPARP